MGDFCLVAQTYKTCTDCLLPQYLLSLFLVTGTRCKLQDIYIYIYTCVCVCVCVCVHVFMFMRISIYVYLVSVFLTFTLDCVS